MKIVIKHIDILIFFVTAFLLFNFKTTPIKSESENISTTQTKVIEINAIESNSIKKSEYRAYDI